MQKAPPVKSEDPGNIIGNPDILRRSLLGLSCSLRCPPRLILATHDLGARLGMAGIGVISGFHSPVEREVLRVLLRGGGDVVLCTARDVAGMKVRDEYRGAMAEERMVIVGGSNAARVSRLSSLERNRRVVSLAHSLFITHAVPDGGVWRVAIEALESGMQVWTWNHHACSALIVNGAAGVDPDTESIDRYIRGIAGFL